MKSRKAICSAAIGLGLFLSMWVGVPALPTRAQSSVPETLDLVLVIDNSNSMLDTDEWDLRIATARLLIDVASTDFEASRVRVGVVTFGDQAMRSTEGLVYANTIEHARDVVEAELQGNTLIEHAFREAYQMLEEAESYAKPHTTAVVFMTDGRPYDGRAESPEDYEQLFDNAQPWIDRLIENGTPVYIGAFNQEEEMPVLDRERWQAFADATGGEYDVVENIEGASEFFQRMIVQLIFGREPRMIIRGQVITPSEIVSEEFEVDAFIDRVAIAAVHTHQRAFIEARLFGPNGAGGEVEIRCGQENWAAEDVKCRGLEQDDTETVWTLVRPQPGTYRIEFKGGEGYIKAWNVSRAFGLVVVEPGVGVLLSPGDPLRLEVGLCETTWEAVRSCQEDPSESLVEGLNYPNEFLASLEMNVTVQDPSGAQSRPATMDYDSKHARFTYSVAQEAEPGVYRLDVVLYYGREIKRLGANSTNVYVGYLPAIQSLEVSEEEDDDLEGISALEPLELRVLIDNPDLAIPGSLMMTGSTLTYPNGDRVNVAPAAAPGITNLFTASLGPFDMLGTYTVEARLRGQVQVDENNLFEFGGVKQQPGMETVTFAVLPLVQPRLESVAVLSQTTTGQAIPVRAEVSLSRRAAEIPVIEATLVSPKGQAVASIALATQDEPFPSGHLAYAGELRAPSRPGDYTVRVSLEGGEPQTSVVVVRYPLWMRITIWAIGALVVVGIGYGVYWFVAVRDLVPRVVIGTLIVERKVEGGVLEREGEPVALSRDPRKEIPLSPYAPDPEVLAVKARLVGRVKDRREQVAPLLKMSRETDDVTVENVRGTELPLDEGVRIFTPNYQLTYRLGGEVSSPMMDMPLPPSDEESTLPPTEPRSGGINV